MRHELKVDLNISTVDGLPYDTLVVDTFEDRVQLQAFRTGGFDDSMIIRSPAIDIDFETFDKLRDIISTERGK